MDLCVQKSGPWFHGLIATAPWTEEMEQRAPEWRRPGGCPEQVVANKTQAKPWENHRKMVV